MNGDVDPASLLDRSAFPPPGTEVRCGVSGGADSLALLVLAVHSGCIVEAVHVDHGLRPGSAEESDVVAAAAARFGAAFRATRVEVAPGPNLEARARRARHGALGPDALLGHTMDDQAETVLINLLRGAGADGLSAMRVGPRHPLLGLRRAETRALCRCVGLTEIADPSNEDRRFLRNRVRHELLPLCNELAGRDVVPVLARQAALLADEVDLLESLAAELDPADAAALSSSPAALARRAVRTLLRGSGPYPPDFAAVERVLAVARGEAKGTEVVPGVRVRRSRGRLSATALPAPPSGSVGAR